MAYATLEDLRRHIPERALVELSADDPAAVLPDLPVLAELQAVADARIDGYLLGRYSLPLASVPALIRDISVKLTRLALYSRRPESDLPPVVEADAKTAQQLLEQIAAGKLLLGLAGVSHEAPGSGLAFRTRDREFGDL